MPEPNLGAYGGICSGGFCLGGWGARSQIEEEEEEEERDRWGRLALAMGNDMVWQENR
ncbi:unnamed protein product, partial [Ilex paraguariensis]